MSTPAQVPLIDTRTNLPGMVDAGNLDAALATGNYERAYRMQNEKGQIGYVAESHVADARNHKMALTSDNPGVQRMATPEGQITYALPSEVKDFSSTGHIAIGDDGNFRVDPLPGESNFETMARAAKIYKNLPPEVAKEAIEAEKKNLPKRALASVVAAPVIGATGAAAMTGLGEGAEALFGPSEVAVPGGTGFGGAAPSTVAGPSLASAAAGKIGQTLAAHGFKYAIGAAGLSGAYRLLKTFGIL